MGGGPNEVSFAGGKHIFSKPGAVKQGEDATPSLLASAKSQFNAYCSKEAVSAYSVVSLKGATHELDEGRTPVNIVAVVDVSGSMGGEKMKLLKETMEFVTKNLRESDRMAIVSYDRDVDVVLRPKQMDADGKKDAMGVIKGLAAGTTTNLSGGLLKGIDVMRGLMKADEINSILLMTDGLANVGIIETDALCSAMSAGLEGERGSTSVYTFGYGAKHNASMLKCISDVGGGMYYFIEETDAIPEAFADCLGGLMSVVAQNITVTIKAANGGRIDDVYTTKKKTFNDDKSSCEINLGDVQSEEQKDLLVKLLLPAIKEPIEGSQPHLEFEVKYYDVVNKRFFTSTGDCCAERLADVVERVENADVQKQIYRNETTAVMRDAIRMADMGNVGEAHKRVTDVLSRMTAVKTAYADELCDDLRQCKQGLRDKRAYKAEGAYKLNSCVQSHSMQRSNMVRHARGYASYDSPCKAAMRSKLTRK